MKPTYLLLGICVVFLLTTCTPEFNLNATYKDVPVVYGILNFRDSVNYVKIYKGFQPKESGAVFVDTQNPDSIYYYDDITVVLEEFENDNRTLREDIPLIMTDYKTAGLKKEPGVFYSGDGGIVYYTKEKLLEDKNYNIKVTHKNYEGKITEGRTPIVGDFELVFYSTQFDMLRKDLSIPFTAANNAKDYEFNINFIYFEVDKNTNKVLKVDTIVKRITTIGQAISTTATGELKKNFTVTFYDDIAGRLKSNPNVVRYIGAPNSNGRCIQIRGWAVGESYVKFLQSNQPTASYIQVNKIYTNMTSTDSLVFGFLSSRNYTSKMFQTTPTSQDSLIYGSRTRHLGFRPLLEYKP